MRYPVNKRRGKKFEAGGRYKSKKQRGRPKAKRDVQGDGRKCGGAHHLDIKIAQEATRRYRREQTKAIAREHQCV